MTGQLSQSIQILTKLERQYKCDATITSESSTSPVGFSMATVEAVFLALKDFQPQLEQRHVLIRTDNISVVSYINHQGGIRSKPLYEQAAALLLWADHIFLSIRAAHIPGLLKILPLVLSQVPNPELWSLHIWLLRGYQRS